MDFKSKFRESLVADEHERYSQLCALITAGAVTSDERTELNAHLSTCKKCAELLRAYRGIAKSAMPLVAALGRAEPASEQKPWSVENAKKQLLNRIEASRAMEKPRVVTAPATQVKARRWGTFVLERALLGATAIVALLALLAAFVYRMGELRGIKSATSSATFSGSRQAEPVQARADQRLLEQHLAEQIREVSRLEQELKEKMAAISAARLLQGKLQQDTRQQGSTIASLGSEKDKLAAERDSLTRKLQEAQSSLANTQDRLADLQQEQIRQSVHTASLQRRVNELSAELAENREATEPSREAGLYADGDIRELMGARELYIADVFDVDRDGKPQKAFGRIFYTGGKSLIFYGFDLDRQPGVREASTFQAWGRRGPADKHPVSMGAFTLDNVANRRWVLRFDNPKMLAQLDAVFVTVESRSGGQKPTGKQLLFASLRIPPNHP
jgi:anti-sigma factor RsiW